MQNEEKSQIMVDLETLGTSSHAVILSIGAVRFQNGNIIDRFYRKIDPKSCTDAGLKIDATTVAWWMQQSDEARKEFSMPGKQLKDVLEEFSFWFSSPVPVWGNGAAFDNVILRSAFGAAGIPCPWPFWLDRCYRTMKEVSLVSAPLRQGVAHNALDDAVFQTLHLIAILKSLEGVE